MLVLRWNQRAHYWLLGRPKGHIRGPKGHSALWKRPSENPGAHCILQCVLQEVIMCVPLRPGGTQLGTFWGRSHWRGQTWVRDGWGVWRGSSPPRWAPTLHGQWAKAPGGGEIWVRGGKEREGRRGGKGEGRRKKGRMERAEIGEVEKILNI